jgi:hypothetical protein
MHISMAQGELEIPPGMPTTGVVCPKCKSEKCFLIPGTYKVADARFLFTPLSEAEERAILKAIGLLERVISQQAEPQQVASEGRRLVPSFNPLWEWLAKAENRKEACNYVLAATGLLGLMVSGYAAIKPTTVQVLLPPEFVEAVEKSRQRTLLDSRTERNKQLKAARSKQSESKPKRPFP